MYSLCCFLNAGLLERFAPKASPKNMSSIPNFPLNFSTILPLGSSFMSFISEILSLNLFSNSEPLSKILLNFLVTEPNLFLMSLLNET